MCDQATRDRVNQVVQGKIKRGEPFSAWDVTLELRVEFPTIREHHSEVKKVVHAAFNSGNMGQYVKTPALFNGINQAFVYHPSSIDANAYASGTLQKSATTAVADPDDDDDGDDSFVTSGIKSNSYCGTPSPGGASADSSASVQKTLNLDANTIYVPGPQVSALGLDIGDAAYVRIDGSAIKILPDSSMGGNEIHVDLRGNLRVNTSYLAEAGISGRRLNISFVEQSLPMPGAKALDEIIITE